MLRHPSRTYIYYLLSERRLDVAGIVQLLGDLKLPVPQDLFPLEAFVRALLAERQKMRFPARFDPLGRPMNHETEGFLSEWKIYGMWVHDPMVDRALDILVEPRIRRFIEVLLLGPLQRGVIAKKTREHFGLDDRSMNTGVIRSYEHYFWDYGALTQQEWRHFVHDWLPGPNPDFLMAVMATNDAAGAALTLTAAGSPGSLTNTVALQAMRDGFFKMFMEHSLSDRPSLARTQAALAAFQGFAAAEETLDQYRGGSAELLEELAKIETVYDKRPVTSIHELPLGLKALPENAVIDIEPESEEDP